MVFTITVIESLFSAQDTTTRAWIKRVLGRSHYKLNRVESEATITWIHIKMHSPGKEDPPSIPTPH